MIQALATKYSKLIGIFFFALFYLGFVTPSLAQHTNAIFLPKLNHDGRMDFNGANPSTYHKIPVIEKTVTTKPILSVERTNAHIGGPNQPEMSSFQSAGVNNMVNLFTGDFSYNIPLLDVGGYPVNLFYSGGIGSEQEASWVGLGWNINPGSVNRNVRGVPDDFNGDELTQVQNMKPNSTWGANFSGDVEVMGAKDIIGAKLGLNLGVSYNNYLGPALEMGVKGGMAFKLPEKVVSEKSGYAKGSLTINESVSSRYGVTITPNFSFTAKAYQLNNLTAGLNMTTSYNSRTGIRSLQVSDQMSFNSKEAAMGTSIHTGASGRMATSISFTRPSYIPSLRMPVTNTASSEHVQLGYGKEGVYASAEVEVYKQFSEVQSSQQTLHKPMVGYLYAENAQNNPNAVMDFTRFNDKEVTPKTPVISVPQYTYDVFSIQGEGTGGSIRAYRNDLGAVRDNFTQTKDKSNSGGGDASFDGISHFGGNFNTIKTPSTIGEWKGGNNIKEPAKFKAPQDGVENIYFRNPGETSVLNPHQFDQIGGTDLVRFQLGGDDKNPTVEPILQRINSAGDILGTVNITQVQPPQERKKRSQVITMLTAEQAKQVGLESDIRSYKKDLKPDNTLDYDPISRVGGVRLAHHLSQINVTESDGKRYIYGIPVYNNTQTDFVFSVNQDASYQGEQVGYDPANDNQLSSSYLKSSDKSGVDGYIQKTTTPAYAHSFLLTGLLSPDYVDVKNDGITEDDLGDAVKFNYTLMGGENNFHKWRSPIEANIAHYNPGNRTEKRDNKALFSYGERESWYVHSIESKTMIAIFTLKSRHDGKGVMGTDGGINSGEDLVKALDKIDLYNKSDIKKNGLLKAKPIKTVFFDYGYSLCIGTPDNANKSEGKLTLNGIHFTYNGQNRGQNDKYQFSYTNNVTQNPDQSATKNQNGNPVYSKNASDRWGTYKTPDLNPDGLINKDYPYSVQDENKINDIHQNAGAWSLKKILLPSGGQIEVNYESDDYAYVQNRRATDMMQVVGLGVTKDAYFDQLYQLSGKNVTENSIAFVHVPDICSTDQDVYNKYLLGIKQLAFRLAVKMPKGEEYLTAYADIDQSSGASYGRKDDHTIWIKLKTIDNKSPLTISALTFLREQLPGQAFPGYDVSESLGLKQVAEMLRGMEVAVKGAFKDPMEYFEQQGMGQYIIPTKTFVRLNDPNGKKFGGGHRVKSVVLKDNWDRMKQQYASEYGQQYDYTTTEIVGGVEKSISSGVASYEPTIGGEENPFQEILEVVNTLPMGPSSYGAIEMPVLDAFFPAPCVGYSKVTVRSLHRGDLPAKLRSAIGKQVTEYYTAKDFPVTYSYTSLDNESDKEKHQNSVEMFLYKYAFDSRALSQGFLVVTNDMHGKLKSQASFAENDEKTPVNFTQNFYRNTGVNGLDETFDFISAADQGKVTPGNMGVDIELMTDTREFSVNSKSREVQGQLDELIIPPGWFPTIWPVIGYSENTYRAVTTTKVINYHGILDKVSVKDNGSEVSTQNKVYDAETGMVVVNQTNNEYDQPVYTTSYPAYWAYSGMGPAYKNIDAVYSAVNFSDGKALMDNGEFESGDELYIMNTPSAGNSCKPQNSSLDIKKLWAVDQNKDHADQTASSATPFIPSYVFVDETGQPFTGNNVTFRILRSGKRNLLGASVQTISSLVDPVQKMTNADGSVSKALKIDLNNKVISASAVEYKEKWQADHGVIARANTVKVNCDYVEQADCNGDHLEKNINPYLKGLLGNFRANHSMVFYNNRSDVDPTMPASISNPSDAGKSGYLTNFKPYWDFKSIMQGVPIRFMSANNPDWVWNNQSTRFNAKGLELETQNALKIFTAAQYGFNKTLPIAITNNSQYNESFYEGFEDFGFDNSLKTSNSGICIEDKHIDFSSFPNTDAQIINTDNKNFSAHTGKYVLGVANNTTVSKQIAVNSPVPLDYNLQFGTGILTTLTDLGGNATLDNPNPNPNNNESPAWTFEPNFNESPSPIARVKVVPKDKSTKVPCSGNLCDGYSHSYGISFDSYINITESREYNFEIDFSTSYGSSSAQVYSNSLTVSIADLNGTTYSSESISKSVFNSQNMQKMYTVFLCKGIYHIVGKGDERYVSLQSSGGTENWYYWRCTNANTPNYKSLNTQTGCHYTMAVAGSEDMMHPTFSLPSSKQMLLSAWVKEDCGDPSQGIPCRQSTYSGNEINIQFNNGQSQPLNFKPSGPIIEGWQRYESMFTVPTGASTATLSLVNNTDKWIYFDDIRIHPYKANMKSFVYDPVSMRLVAQLDENNYASYYEYDEDGTLIRTKAETKDGVKTLNETRSSKQTTINTVQ